MKLAVAVCLYDVFMLPKKKQIVSTIYLYIDLFYLIKTMDPYHRTKEYVESKGYKYKCVYCASHETTLNKMVTHCLENLNKDILKYKELTVDEATQKLGYRRVTPCC